LASAPGVHVAVEGAGVLNSCRLLSRKLKRRPVWLRARKARGGGGGILHARAARSIPLDRGRRMTARTAAYA